MAEETRVLYEIAHEYEELVEVLTNSEDETEIALLTPVVEELTDEFAAKVNACVRMRQNLALRGDQFVEQARVLETEAKRLREAGKRQAGQADRLNDYMTRCLQAGNVSQCETTIGTVFLRRTKVLVIPDEELVSGEYYNMKPTLDRKRLRKAVDAGVADTGALLEEKTSIALR
tara:strand:- start:186 stop:707 length:522 start_codon:yes stop_codon:yes gene_type:complete